MNFLIILFFFFKLLVVNAHELENKVYFSCKGIVRDVLLNEEKKDKTNTFSYYEEKNSLDYKGKRVNGNQKYFICCISI